MKTTLLIISSLIIGLYSYAQIGLGTTNPHESSILDIESSTKGFLPPRMSTSARNNINGGVFAEGLVIYNTDYDCIEFYNNSAWVNICGTAPAPPPDLPGNITLTAGLTKYIASIYDEDYKPYVPSIAVATTGTAVADGGTETLIDIQGVLDISNGITVKIPYSVSSGSIDLLEFNQERTVISDHVQGADPNSNLGGGTPVVVIFNYPAQTSLSGDGFITATIKAKDNPLNAVKLDINAGIGTDIGILLAEFTIALDDAGNTGSIKLKDTPGIPDRMIGQADNTGDVNSHNFLYLPVVSATGRTWLNNNLGADYSNLNHPDFNLAQQATGSTDWKAYGSLFQWGRKADGHELINWIDGATGTAVNSISSSKLDEPSDALFIISAAWRQNQDNTLWANESSTNNVCPEGYRLPLNPNNIDDANNEFSTEADTWSTRNILGAIESNLKIPMSGYRTYGASGGVTSEGINGYYWSGTASTTNARNMQFHPGNPVFTTLENLFGFGYNVRCIQD